MMPVVNDAADLARSNNEFAFAVYSVLAGSEGNLLFSPLSISSLLTTVATGARGETASELFGALRVRLDLSVLEEAQAALNAEVLESTTWQPPRPELEMSAGLWVQQGEEIAPAFRRRLARLGRTAFEELDFAHAPESARARINAWISGSTHDRIPTLIAPGQIRASTRRVLASAIYFKARWEILLEQSRTRPMTFHGPDGQTSAPGMRLEAGLNHASNDELELLELPYAGRDLGFFVALPRTLDGLARCERRLCADPGVLEGLLDRLRPEGFAVTLPRFTFPFEADLVPALRSLGVRTALTPAADFSEIGPGFFMDGVTHDAWIEVNERGTEAAAATVIPWTLSSGLGRPRHFVADHPFLFLVQHRPTRTLIFLGRVVRP
jgi:serpin B